MTDSAAWAAGLFDGEGCTSVHRGGGTKGRPGTYQYPRMAISQLETNREVLEKFQKVVGEGSIAGPYASSRGVSQWRALGEEKVKRILQLLWPELGTAKRAQAARVLEKCGSGVDW